MEDLTKARKELIEVIENGTHDVECSRNTGSSFCDCSLWGLKEAIWDLVREREMFKYVK